MQNKIKITKMFSAFVLGGLAIGIAVLSQSSQSQKQLVLQTDRPVSASSTAYQSPFAEIQDNFRNPIPEETLKKLRAQSARAFKIEKEARFLFKQRRFAEAKAACYRLLAESPKINGGVSNMQALQLLGDIYLEQKRYEDAIETYNRTRRHTRNLELDINTALAYVRLGDLKSARKFFAAEKIFGRDMPNAEKAEYFSQLPGTKNAKSFEASLFYARGCEKDSYGAEPEALKDFEKALRLVPRNALIASSSAWILSSLGRNDEARPLWARAAAFGKGKMVHEARRELKQWATAKQAEQAISDAAKIQ